MRSIDVLKLALQNLWRTRFRSFLTILGVMIGVSAIVLFVSLGVGLQKITTDQLTSFSALTTLTVSQTPATTSMEEGPKLTNDTVVKLKGLNKVKEVSPSVSLPTSVKNGDTSTGAIVTGILIENTDMESSGILFGDKIKTKGEAIISSMLANSFSSDKEKLIGQKIIISIMKNTEGLDFKANETEAVIVGIDNNESANTVITGLESVVPAKEFDKYSTIKVQVNSRKDINPVKDEIKKLGYQVTTINDIMEQVDKIFLLAQIILGLIGGIGLMVSSLGIINTMTISFLERTREIGIMKAIGATDKDIRSLFFIESTLIGFFGGLAGVAIAFLFGSLVNGVINYLIRNSGQELRLFVTPIDFAVVMMALAIVISIFSGLYPTHRAQKLQPIEAIRQ